MSWEDDEWDAPAKDVSVLDNDLTDKWAGEDEDDEALLGDDWDADPEEKKAATAGVPVVKKLTKRQLIKKKEEEEREAARKAMQQAKISADDPDAARKEAAAIKAAITKSNLGLVADCFGGDGYEAPENGEFQNDQLDQDNQDMNTDLDLTAIKALKVKTDEPLEDVVLKTIDDYKKFGERVGKLAGKDEKKQKQIVQFALQVLTECTKKMKLDEANMIKKHLNVICSQKQKDEQGKKKKNNKKAQLQMSSRDDDYGGGDDDYGDMGDFL